RRVDRCLITQLLLAGAAGPGRQVVANGLGVERVLSSFEVRLELHGVQGCIAIRQAGRDVRGEQAGREQTLVGVWARSWRWVTFGPSRTFSISFRTGWKKVTKSSASVLSRASSH